MDTSWLQALGTIVAIVLGLGNTTKLVLDAREKKSEKATEAQKREDEKRRKAQLYGHLDAYLKAHPHGPPSWAKMSLGPDHELRAVAEAEVRLGNLDGKFEGRTLIVRYKA